MEEIVLDGENCKFQTNPNNGFVLFVFVFSLEKKQEQKPNSDLGQKKLRLLNTCIEMIQLTLPCL